MGNCPKVWQRREIMWAFIVCRNNIPEQVKIFDNYWLGAKHADLFVESIYPDMKDQQMPEYNRGEIFSRDDITIGLYSILGIT